MNQITVTTQKKWLRVLRVGFWGTVYLIVAFGVVIFMVNSSFSESSNEGISIISLYFITNCILLYLVLFYFEKRLFVKYSWISIALGLSVIIGSVPVIQTILAGFLLWYLGTCIFIPWFFYAVFSNFIRALKYRAGQITFEDDQSAIEKLIKQNPQNDQL